MNENNFNNNAQNNNQMNQVNNNQNLYQNQVPNQMPNTNNEWVDLNSIGQPPKKSSALVKVFASLLGIGVLAGGGFYAYKEFFEKKEVNSNTNINETKKDQVEERNQEEQKSSVETKDYVIDAKYEAKVTKNSYSLNGEEFKVSDIVVPYITIENSATKEINADIKKLYDQFIERYEDISSVEIDPTEESTYYEYIKTNYEYTIKDDIISILIKVDCTGRGSSIAEEYYAYNYDLKEEKILSLEDLCKKLNLNYENVIKIVNESMDTSIQKRYEITSPLPEGQEEMDDYIKSNKEYFAEQMKNKKEYFYIDEKNQVNVIVLNEHPLGGCGFYYDFVAITE